MRILRKIEDIICVMAIAAMIFFGILFAEGSRFEQFRPGRGDRGC